MSKKYNNPKPKFTRGDKVKVISGGANCSDVTMELHCHPLGVYNIPNYKDKIFTITDNSFTVKNFIDEDINVCVVSHNKKIIGAVYEYALEKVNLPDEEPILIEKNIDVKQPSIETNLEQLRCGQCGQKKHELFIRPNGEIITECITCKTKSVITLTKPQITIEFHENSTGRLAKF